MSSGDPDVRARLEAAIDTLDDAQRRRLLDWAGSISSKLPNARAAGDSIGPLADQLHIRQEGAEAGALGANRNDFNLSEHLAPLGCPL